MTPIKVEPPLAISEETTIFLKHKNLSQANTILPI